jgi:hypothetical protein
MKRTTLLFLVTIALIAPIANAQVTAQLQVLPEKMLPGIPPWILIRVVNGSTAPVQLLNGASLEVTPPSGSRFYAEWQGGHMSESFGEDQRSLLLVPAGATNDLILPLDTSLATPAFFFDPRLNVPGSYIFRIILYRQMAGSPNEKVITNEVPFTVEQPDGEDAVVWNRMQQLASGKWSSDAWGSYALRLAWEIYTEHRSSHYFPYVAAFKPSDTLAEKLQVIQEAIASNPSGPIADSLRLSAAAAHGFLASEAFKAKQVDRAISEAESARAIAEDVRSHSTFPFIRTMAAQAVAALTTPDQFRAYHEYLNGEIVPPPPPTRAVIPKSTCVDVVGKTLVARFGYENPNSTFKMIPAGTANQVKSSDKNSKQTFSPPERFEPGTHEHVFSAIDEADVLTWLLDGASVSADRNLPRCSPPPAQQPVRPLIDCVKKPGNSTNLAVSFGYQNPNSYAVVIANGPDNHTTPVDKTLPPTLFLSGLNHEAWTIKVKANAVSWVLQGSSATAPGSGIPDCKDE